jgi:undecaprenyl pyrophosphate phosphatase UppP
MRLSQYLKHFLQDSLKACGCLMIVASIFFGINSIETIKTSLLWQIIIIASAYTLFKFAFVNNLDLGKKAQLIVFTICSTLADIMVVLWLCLFSPNIDSNIIIIYIIVILIVKGAVFAMMYIDGQKQAKQLNEKLSEYKNGTSE